MLSPELRKDLEERLREATTLGVASSLFKRR